MKFVDALTTFPKSLRATFAGVVVCAAALGDPRTHAVAAIPQPLPGWRMELLLSAPQVRHPSVVCTAPDGRIFVAEDPMDISAPRADLPQGRILCLHTNGSITVFRDESLRVFGMQFLEGKLFVCTIRSSPSFATTTAWAANRADLIEQTHPNPWALDWNDHVPANFRLAMDGFFYIAVGDKGLFGAVDRSGKRVDLHGGGVVRIRPDGTGLEVFLPRHAQHSRRRDDERRRTVSLTTTRTSTNGWAAHAHGRWRLLRLSVRLSFRAGPTRFGCWRITVPARRAERWLTRMNALAGRVSRQLVPR
jgi:hypothetical protein